MHWNRDELILALDLYFRLDAKEIKPTNPKVIELRKLINSLPIHKNYGRSMDAVLMKLGNFQSWDPNYKGKGLSNGSKLEGEVWNEFYNSKQKLHELAIKIMSGGELEREIVANLTDIDEDEFPEGNTLYRMHAHIERNSSAVNRKKRAAVKSNKLKCEICSFDFYKTYGEIGEGYIECHHIVPISEYKIEGKTKTSLKELALVCSNCHRMLHRKRPWLSIDELKALVNQKGGVLS